MLSIGFSTGAIALGDFRRAFELLRILPDCNAVELSALREHELEPLVAAIPTLDLSHFRHRSVHAPSVFSPNAEDKVIQLLGTLAEMGIPIVLHPDATPDLRKWKRFGTALLIENMDKRKRTGRTVGELDRAFEIVPEARLCFDIAHARQVDPTMSEAWLILRRFGQRLGQVHLSEVDLHGRHTRLTVAAAIAYPPILSSIPESCPIILESRVAAGEVAAELAFARSLCDGNRARIGVKAL